MVVVNCSEPLTSVSRTACTPHVTLRRRKEEVQRAVYLISANPPRISSQNTGRYLRPRACHTTSGIMPRRIVPVIPSKVCIKDAKTRDKRRNAGRGDALRGMQVQKDGNGRWSRESGVGEMHEVFWWKLPFRCHQRIGQVPRYAKENPSDPPRCSVDPLDPLSQSQPTGSLSYRVNRG